MSSIKLIDPVVTTKVDGVIVEECYIEIQYSHLSYTEIDSFIKALLAAKELCLEVNDKIPTDKIPYEEYNSLKNKLYDLIDEANIGIDKYDEWM